MLLLLMGMLLLLELDLLGDDKVGVMVRDMEGSFILCKANKAAVEVRDLVGLAANARLISGGVIGNIFAISGGL